MGNFYTQLVQTQKPQTIVEFGTAFGISGMYFLAGLEINNNGRLLTFEVNKDWVKIAEKNLKQISNKFILTKGLFEKNIEKKLTKNETINLAFVDAIHTQEFILQQIEIVLQYSKKGTNYYN